MGVSGTKSTSKHTHPTNMQNLNIRYNTMTIVAVIKIYCSFYAYELVYINVSNLVPRLNKAYTKYVSA